MALPAGDGVLGLGLGMDAAAAPAPPEPITMSEAIDSLLKLLIRIRQKLHTLISWYIDLEVTPNAIQAYEPRLMILYDRLMAMRTLSYTQLPYLIDNSDALAAQYLIDIASQLSNAAHGIQTIFVNHYDRDLEERQPFAAISDTLAYRTDQLRLVPTLNPSNPLRLRAEDMRGGTNELGYFCRGALQLNNNLDKGRVSFVDKKTELSEDDRLKLRVVGGAFLNWECPECAYKGRYHVASSGASNIHTTDDFRQHDDVALQYRSSFLAKCHFYLPLSDSNAMPPTRTLSRRRVGTGGGGHGLGGGYAKPLLQYGCVFCFAQGVQLDRGNGAFITARTLAEHIALKHGGPLLPPSFILHRFLVAVDGKLLDPRQRWDLNFV
ncbi:hypothetical protein HRR83_001676 [Exophiala dermatitidis]|uniref:Uncharacterized protein n=2 Tax=Exophiala dermatitidis TaxID=5970 RepID=H6C5Q9_EXODN|nr:uncharacterized protein HMPREF1120_07054 [Exophiala dermatitidis NIH/UT8656]KAJ4516347.1 hypothetical protein HRR73_004810 [Exophiala dermatitidis]EHY59055.1 hypothetical protein HMPREF1120_07054 [Exophiala dermatitidis NIH/UT8656]KAJ4526482.1 hypothetical protein HRR74_001680 [Exophiala dermatitidis]KAJ4532272.1 hypothetical protein HRR76_007270 [Exophiala dermatitidis]KAJ4546309.1 hypothetical protein HRR77_004844 [Exophiala dermatitidis]